MEALVQLGIARCTASDGKPVFLPGVFDETWLPAFSGRIYRQLGEADCLHFAKALRFYDNHIYWGSACSGAGHLGSASTVSLLRWHRRDFM